MSCIITYNGQNFTQEDFLDYLKSQIPTSINNPSEFVNHSGGAKGYDAEWDIIGSEYGMVNNKHYLLPEDGEVSDLRLRSKGVKPVDATNDIGHVAKTGPVTGEAQLAVSQAERLMGRIESTHFTRNTKKIRNYTQVKNADGIFAIGSLIPKGAEITIARGQATKKALVPQVNGGTSVAVQLGITMNKPTYVFNQVANDTYSQGWYKWDNTKQDFVSVITPVLTKNFAGIGTSSNTTEVGKQAIRDVYEKTFNQFEQGLNSPTSINTIKEGVTEVFKNTPELASIGTQQQYSAYLETIFPDSKVKDIVYHGSDTLFERFSKNELGRTTGADSAKKGFFFGSNRLNSTQYSTEGSENLIKNLKEILKSLEKINSIKDITPQLYRVLGGKSHIEELIKDFKKSSMQKYNVYDIKNNLYIYSEFFSAAVDGYYVTLEEGYDNNGRIIFNTEKEAIDYFTNIKNEGEEIDEHEIEYSVINHLGEEIQRKIDKLEFQDDLDSRDRVIKQNNILYSVILNMQNPLVQDDLNFEARTLTFSKVIDNALTLNNDSVCITNTTDPFPTNVFVVFEPEQIHILGSKQDIERFKDFVNNNSSNPSSKNETNTEKKIEPIKPQSKEFITNKVNSNFDKYGYVDILTSGKNNFDFKSAVIKYILKDLGLEFKSDKELNNYLIKEKNEGRTFNLMQYVTLEEIPDNKTRVKLNKRNLLLDSVEDFKPKSLGGLSFTSSGRDFESKNIFKNNIEQAFNCK